MKLKDLKERIQKLKVDFDVADYIAVGAAVVVVSPIVWRLIRLWICLWSWAVGAECFV